MEITMRPYAGRQLWKGSWRGLGGWLTRRTKRMTTELPWGLTTFGNRELVGYFFTVSHVHDVSNLGKCIIIDIIFFQNLISCNLCASFLWKFFEVSQLCLDNNSSCLWMKLSLRHFHNFQKVGTYWNASSKTCKHWKFFSLAPIQDLISLVNHCKWFYNMAYPPKSQIDYKWLKSS